MMHDPIYRHSADSIEQLEPTQSRPSERLSPVSLMSAEPALSALSISALAKHCIGEICNYRNGEPSNELYGLELFHRAIVQSNLDAWLCLQQCFSELVFSWLRRHPRKEEAYRFDSEENYVARAFQKPPGMRDPVRPGTLLAPILSSYTGESNVYLEGSKVN